MNSITPNFVAYLALFAWPLLALVLYRSLTFVEATIWTILLAQLLLPVGTYVKIEMIPQFDRGSIPNLCILAAFMTISARRLPPARRGFGLVEWLIAADLLSPLVTSLLNTDAIVVGTTVLPGVGPYDGLSSVVAQSIMLIPFFIGRRMARDSEDLTYILWALAAAGLVYSLLLLFEIRFSPQLHFWLYGYYPTDFVQQVRDGGGFRPMAFMGHGLIACFFLMTTTVACTALWRLRRRVLGVKAGPATLYLGVVLTICKSGAALAYCIFLAPLVAWASPRLQMTIAIVLTSLALLYPLMRLADLVPTRALVEISGSFSQSRADSLKFRFDQEEELLGKVMERPLFGWGRYGRNRVFKEDWQGVGVDSSVTDGRWIIALGQFGLFGFFAEFGLLAVSVFRAKAALRRIPDLPTLIAFSAIALIVAANIIDLLPNSTLSPWSWLVAGSLLGASERVRQPARQPAKLPLALQPG